jgi:beta-lactamase regulating signal transducer with metallopeptidase domain
MNSFIETLDLWGGRFLGFAWPMLWQSSLLIAILLAIDLVFRLRLRASIRYVLWLVLLVKLLLPPTLALPTSPAWWLHLSPAKIQTTAVVIYDPQTIPTFAQPAVPDFNPVQPAISFAAWALVAAGVIGTGLFGWLLIRWLQVNRKVQDAIQSEKLIPILDEVRGLADSRSKIKVRLTEDSLSPAVCGLIRPVILLPRSLVEKLSAGQVRAVLLHELIHLRRGDVWMNCLQMLLQIFYWWHPLLWFANARIRQVREEAVDDSVMLALAGDSDSYAPTLLEVAKFAFDRPLTSLGLIGILESHSALRLRIERLVNFSAPRKSGITLAALFAILAFTAVAVPMGQPPLSAEPQSFVGTKNANASQQIHIKARFIEVPENMMVTLVKFPGFTNGATIILTPANARIFLKALESIHGFKTLAAPEVTTTSGLRTQIRETTAQTIVTNCVYQENSTNSASAVTFQTGQIEFGPVLDIVPHVLSDGLKIALTTTASDTKFFGYATPPPKKLFGSPDYSQTRWITNSAGQKMGLPIMLPVFQLNQACVESSVLDGQTLVLFPTAESQTDQRLAKHIALAEKKNGKKVIIVMITPTIVDPAGNPTHPATPHEAVVSIVPLADNSIPVTAG